MKKFSEFVLVIFSFFLAFGKYDPFFTDGVYFDFIVTVLIISLILYKDVRNNFRKIKVELGYLVFIGLLLYFIGLFYHIFNQVYFSDQEYIFNFKYFAAVIVFLLLCLVFESNSKLMYTSIFVFSLSCAIISFLHFYGYFGSEFEIRNGRLIIFEENPNSISSRMAIAFSVFIYFIINDPLKFKVYRYILFLGLPSLVLFIIETGSRGSFIAIGLSLLSILFFSKMKIQWRLSLIFILFCIIYSFFELFLTTSLYERLNNSDLDGGRLQLWSNTLDIFYDFPLGVGENGYKNELFGRFGMTSDTHNLFLYILASGGFFVFILFLSFLQRLLRKSLLSMKEGAPLGLLLFIFMIFLMFKTGGIFTYLIMWYTFAVINTIPKVNQVE